MPCISVQRQCLPTCRTAHHASPVGRSMMLHKASLTRPRFVAAFDSAPDTRPEVQGLDPESDLARKKAEAEKLRAAEKFMVIGSGEATCGGCGYEYRPERGDAEFPVPKGTLFQNTPSDYQCPVCGAPKSRFESRMKVVAGFAENQKYGLGTNSMTGEQKTLIIYGALGLFFILFLLGYALD